MAGSRRPGSDNLRPPQSPEEAREMGRKGGIASGRARRRKKAMRVALNAMLGAPATSGMVDLLVELGLDPEDADIQAGLLAAMLKKAASGHVGAFEQLVRISGNDPELALRKAELKERAREFDEDMALRRQMLDEKRNGGESSAWIDALASEGYEKDSATREDADDGDG